MTKDEAVSILESIARSIEIGNLELNEYYRKETPEYCSDFRKAIPAVIREAVNILKCQDR